MMIASHSKHSRDSLLRAVEATLRTRIQTEEAQYHDSKKPYDSLWNHVIRVASLAQRIGISEGIDPVVCRLAGLFHDAGKFRGGGYHNDNKPEEEWSVITLHEITSGMGFMPSAIHLTEEAILQLYRDDPEPTVLARILFDADNLDKLGPVGVANYCVKAGLRGKSISPAFIYRITVELTYARYASECLTTSKGRQIARARGPQTISFLKSFLESLKEDEVYSFQIKETSYDGLTLDVVTPEVCSCGQSLTLKIWEVPGLKCSEIHLNHICEYCNFQHELKFCRPRILQLEN